MVYVYIYIFASKIDLEFDLACVFWFQLDILRPKLATPKKRSGSLRTARRFSKPSPVAKDLFRVGMFCCWVFWGWDEAIEFTHQQFLFDELGNMDLSD